MSLAARFWGYERRVICSIKTAIQEDWMNRVHLVGSRREKKRRHLTFCWISCLIVLSILYPVGKIVGLQCFLQYFTLFSAAKWIDFLFFNFILYYFYKGKLLILVYLFYNSVIVSNSFSRILFFFIDNHSYLS